VVLESLEAELLGFESILDHVEECVPRCVHEVFVLLGEVVADL